MSEEEIIETLKEFEKNRVEQLKEPSKNLFYAIMKIADERDKYKIVLDKIKEYLEEDDWESVNGVIAVKLIKEKLNDLLEKIE